jgi:hypothetical protein
MTIIGLVRMRYPGGDPENGPAYPQRWTGSQWECAKHDWRECENFEDSETGEVAKFTACARCGEYE